MKKILNRYTLSLAMLMTLLLSACTHHNGDIGPYFGTWKVDAITIDGNDDKEYADNMFWKFQSDVICMIVVDDTTHSRNEYWGTWSEDGPTLTLNYTYSDDRYQQGTSRYAPPAASHLPAGILNLRIVSQSGSEMQLEYTAGDGTSYSYNLTKW